MSLSTKIDFRGVILTKDAEKDRKKLMAARLGGKAQELLRIIRENPFQNPPPYEKLVGDFKGAYSRRINGQHRLVYSISSENRIIHVVRMWGHYE